MIKEVLALKKLHSCIFLTEKTCNILHVFNSPRGGQVTQVVSTVLERTAKQEEGISRAKGFPNSLISSKLTTDCFIEFYSVTL